MVPQLLTKFLSILSLNVALVYGNICFQSYPSLMKFGTAAEPLHIYDLSDVLLACLGYTVDRLNWPGLTINSPEYPSAAVVFGLKNGGANIDMNATTTIEIIEDYSLNDAYSDLQSRISKTSYRPVDFQNVTPGEINNDLLLFKTKTNHLVQKRPVDSKFIEDVSSLDSLPEYIKGLKQHENQLHVVFIHIDSFADLVKDYGAGSDEVNEASAMLRKSIDAVIPKLNNYFNGKVIIATVQLAEDGVVTKRSKRQAITNDDEEPSIFSDKEGPKTFQNIAAVTSNDFPVIFNIVLILSIILLVAILSSSVAIAFMDPGRDSIIYRMTNPRMKKDQ